MIKLLFVFLFSLMSVNLFADRPVSYFRNLPSLDIPKCENVILKDKTCVQNKKKPSVLKDQSSIIVPKCENALMNDRSCIDKSGKKIYRPDERRYFSPVL
ncbi:MAG: hypothetical protein Q8L85_08900 [Alphaproteobacteria bacterium]|nr:hypothetical protein [Alphaproteobacteria bacterium]